MTEHYSKATVEVSEWCKKCHKFTPHRVLGGKLAGCKVCEAQPAKPKPAAPPFYAYAAKVEADHAAAVKTAARKAALAAFHEKAAQR